MKWNNKDWDDAANENGALHVTLRMFAEGGRETLETELSVTMDEDNGEWWRVTATVVKSDTEHEGSSIQFELDKSAPINELDCAINDVLNT